MVAVCQAYSKPAYSIIIITITIIIIIYLFVFITLGSKDPED